MYEDRRQGGSLQPDAGISMIFMLITMMLIGTLSLVVIAQLGTEVRQTAFARKHQQTVNTALGGINVGLNTIRNAVNSSGAGVRANLPCTTGSSRTTLTGFLDAGNALSYTTDVYYLGSVRLR